MSTNYFFYQSDVCVSFQDENKMNKQVESFEKKVKEHDEDDELSEFGRFQAYVVKEKIKENAFQARILIDANSDDYVDVDGLAELICKYFPTANGGIGYAEAEVSAGGFTRYAGGGRINIQRGEIL